MSEDKPGMICVTLQSITCQTILVHIFTVLDMHIQYNLNNFLAASYFKGNDNVSVLLATYYHQWCPSKVYVIAVAKVGHVPPIKTTLFKHLFA